jgi:hypothetical protein
MKIFDGVLPVITEFKGLLKDKIKNKEILIKFDYPIDKPVIRKFKNKNGFDLADIIGCIIKGYEDIYKNEEKWCKIWGHSIEDLVIENIHYNEKRNLITMDIGS